METHEDQVRTLPKVPCSQQIWPCISLHNHCPAAANLREQGRVQTPAERRIRAARFPAVKSFETFDFTAIPGLNKMLVLELARCEYILRRENIIAPGQQWRRQDACRAHTRSGGLPERLLGDVHDRRSTG
jgi:IstB-like ATP binding protein